MGSVSPKACRRARGPLVSGSTWQRQVRIEDVCQACPTSIRLLLPNSQPLTGGRLSACRQGLAPSSGKCREWTLGRPPARLPLGVPIDRAAGVASIAAHRLRRASFPVQALPLGCTCVRPPHRRRPARFLSAYELRTPGKRQQPLGIFRQR